MAAKEFFVHPLKKKNRGLRSGKPLLKAGKLISKDKDGYEVLDDYFGESDAEHTLELHRSSIEFRQPLTEIDDDRITASQPTPVSHRLIRKRNNVSKKSVTSSVSSKVSSISQSNPVAWVHHKNIGRRTGKDIKAGKDIRKGADGFENFDDYWSESDADSIMLSRLEEKSRVNSPVPEKEELQDTEDSEPAGDVTLTGSSTKIQTEHSLTGKNNELSSNKNEKSFQGLEQLADVMRDEFSNQNESDVLSKSVESSEGETSDDRNINNVSTENQDDLLSASSAGSSEGKETPSLNEDEQYSNTSTRDKDSCPDDGRGSMNDQQSLNEHSGSSYEASETANSEEMGNKASNMEKDDMEDKTTEMNNKRDKLDMKSNTTDEDCVSEEENVENEDEKSAAENYEDGCSPDESSGQGCNTSKTHQTKCSESEEYGAASLDGINPELKPQHKISTSSQNIDPKTLQDKRRSSSVDDNNETPHTDNETNNSHSTSSVIINGRKHASSPSDKEASPNEKQQNIFQNERRRTFQKTYIDIDNEVDIVEELGNDVHKSTVKENRRKSAKNYSERASQADIKDVTLEHDQGRNSPQSTELDGSVKQSKENKNRKTRGKQTRKSLRKESDDDNVDIQDDTHTEATRTSRRKSTKEINASSKKFSIKSNKKKLKGRKSELTDNDDVLTKENGTNVCVHNEGADIEAFKGEPRTRELNVQTDVLGKTNTEDGYTDEQAMDNLNEDNSAGSDLPQESSSVQNVSDVKQKDSGRRTRKKKGKKRKGDKSSNSSPPKTRRSNRIVEQSKHNSGTGGNGETEEKIEKEKEEKQTENEKQEEKDDSTCITDPKDSDSSQNEADQIDKQSLADVNKTGMTLELKNKSGISKAVMPFISMSQTAASIVVGGNQDGSMTEVESNVGITPSFRTRKRLSYSAVLLEKEHSKKKKKKSLTDKLSVEDAVVKEPTSAFKRQTFVFDSNSESGASTCSNNIKQSDKPRNSLIKGRKSFLSIGQSDSDVSTEFLSLKDNGTKSVDNGKMTLNVDHSVEIVDSFSEKAESITQEDVQTLNQKSAKRKSKGKQRKNEKGAVVPTEQLVGDQSVKTGTKSKPQTMKYKKSSKKGNKSGVATEQSTKRVTRRRRKQSESLGEEAGPSTETVDSNQDHEGDNEDIDGDQIGDGANMDTDGDQIEDGANMDTDGDQIGAEANHQQECEDVKPFRQILIAETDKLNHLCQQWEEISSSTADLPEDAKGQLRTVIGQAQLLMDQRFKQFEQLIDNCQYKTGEKETKCTDLQGFWDMIYFQVEDVHTKFDDLNKLKENGWSLSSIQPKKTAQKKKISKPICKKPIGKSKFAEFRAELKNKTAAAVEKKTIDFGFFNVQSPVVKGRMKSIGADHRETPVSRRSIPSAREDTPNNEFPVSILQEEALKSGVSFRRRRTILLKDDDNCRKKLDTSSDNETQGIDGLGGEHHVTHNGNPGVSMHVIQTDEEDNRGKIPNIIRRRSSIRYKPPTEPMDITPIISKSKSKRSKERRVTISRQVIETSYEAANVTGSSGADQTVNTTNSEPVHIFEMTNSATPEPIRNPDDVKIIHPEPAPEGLRRSKRTRVKTLDGFKGERPIYERRKSGLHVIGIQPSLEWKLKAMERKRKERLMAKKKSQFNRRLSGRRLSAHVEIPLMVNPTSSSELTVYNPDQDLDVVMECIGSHEQSLKFGPSQDEPTKEDPFFMTRSLNHPSFAMGMIQLKGLKEKPLQMVTKGTLCFHVVFGKVLVTIQSSSVILSTNDDFCVPKGNAYSINNLRKDNAKLSYVLMKCDESDDENETDEED